MTLQMDKWALVTGASSGIGLAITCRLADKGYNVMMVSNDACRLDAARDMVQGSHRDLLFETICMDLAVPGAAQQLLALTDERGIVPDILVNDAGMFFYDEVVRTSAAELEKIINLHVLTITMMCRLYGEAMARRGSGRILNMSSYSIYMPYPGLAAYCATKAYIRKFSKAFGKEMRRCGVTVTAAAPAGVDTDLMGLPSNIRTLARRTGFLMRPSTAARRLVRATMRGRKYKVPGVYNYLFVPLLPLFSPVSSLLLRRKYKKSF